MSQSTDTDTQYWYLYKIYRYASVSVWEGGPPDPDFLQVKKNPDLGGRDFNNHSHFSSRFHSRNFGGRGWGGYVNLENSRFDWVFLNVSLFKNRYRCQVYVGFGIGYRYQYRFFKVISITSVSKTYRIIGNIPINRYRYGSISKNRCRFGKSPYRYRYIGIGRTLLSTSKNLGKS